MTWETRSTHDHDDANDNDHNNNNHPLTCPGAGNACQFVGGPFCDHQKGIILTYNQVSVFVRCLFCYCHNGDESGKASESGPVGVSSCSGCGKPPLATAWAQEMLSKLFAKLL